jgi:hypothetical protein
MEETKKSLEEKIDKIERGLDNRVIQIIQEMKQRKSDIKRAQKEEKKD